MTAIIKGVFLIDGEIIRITVNNEKKNCYKKNIKYKGDDVVLLAKE